MSDQTVYAEALIAAVARAFYEDEAVCLIDVLIRDKFLRDDDMSPRLSLPAKQLRRTLQVREKFLRPSVAVFDGVLAGEAGEKGGRKGVFQKTGGKASASAAVSARAKEGDRSRSFGFRTGR